MTFSCVMKVMNTRIQRAQRTQQHVLGHEGHGGQSGHEGHGGNGTCHMIKHNAAQGPLESVRHFCNYHVQWTLSSESLIFEVYLAPCFTAHCTTELPYLLKRIF